MKSVWDISANAVLEMANNAKQLEEIDLSNCRKVSDNLLARIVGWIVTEPNTPQNQHPRHKPGQNTFIPPVGTVVGCPNLKRLTLSYCKHVTDRSMAHLAVHAHARLQSIDLTRCTTITDAGFQHWSIYKFAKLERLILADCTYLTDNAIVYLTNAAKGLKELDLVCLPFPDLFLLVFLPNELRDEMNGLLSQEIISKFFYLLPWLTTFPGFEMEIK
jgi:F-box/leucine-rich repeat protein 7